MFSRQLDLLGAPMLLAAAGLFLALLPAEKTAAAPVPGVAAPMLPRPALVFLLIWLATATYGVSLGESRMDRYWHGVFVPLVWLAGQGMAFALWPCRAGERRLRFTATMGVLVLGMVFLRPMAGNVIDDALRAYHFTTTGSERAVLAQVGQRVAEVCPADECIYVVGYSAGVYRFSGRKSASRHAGLDKIDQGMNHAQSMAEEVFTSLQTRRPAAILVEPRRLGALQEDRLGAVVVQGLGAWVAANYDDGGRAGQFHCLVRRDVKQARLTPPTRPS
jgi:hypothetical protein